MGMKSKSKSKWKLELVTNKGVTRAVADTATPAIRTDQRWVHGPKGEAMAVAKSWAGGGAEFFSRGARGDELGYVGANGTVYIYAV